MKRVSLHWKNIFFSLFFFPPPYFLFSFNVSRARAELTFSLFSTFFLHLFPSLPLSLSLSSFFLTLKKLQILCKAFPLPANSLYPFSGSQTHGTKAFSTKAWNESRGNRDPFENVNIVSSKGRKGKKKNVSLKKEDKICREISRFDIRHDLKSDFWSIYLY